MLCTPAKPFVSSYRCGGGAAAWCPLRYCVAISSGPSGKTGTAAYPPEWIPRRIPLARYLIPVRGGRHRSDAAASTPGLLREDTASGIAGPRERQLLPASGTINLPPWLSRRPRLTTSGHRAMIRRESPASAGGPDAGRTVRRNPLLPTTILPSLLCFNGSVSSFVSTGSAHFYGRRAAVAGADSISTLTEELPELILEVLFRAHVTSQRRSYKFGVPPVLTAGTADSFWPPNAAAAADRLLVGGASALNMSPDSLPAGELSFGLHTDPGEAAGSGPARSGPGPWVPSSCWTSSARSAASRPPPGRA